MEKHRRKREKRTEIMREMRDKGERVRDKIYIYFFTILLQCNSILALQFSDADDFKAANAKFALDMALALENANALTYNQKKKKARI